MTDNVVCINGKPYSTRPSEITIPAWIKSYSSDGEPQVWVLGFDAIEGHFVEGAARLVGVDSTSFTGSVCMVDFGHGPVVRWIEIAAQENPNGYVKYLNMSRV